MLIQKWAIDKIKQTLVEDHILYRTNHLAIGDVDTYHLYPDSSWNFVFSRCVGWHNDRNVAVYDDNCKPVLETFIVIQTAGHLVEAGKRQNLPAKQPVGTVFQLDITKNHRLNSKGHKKELWVALFRETLGSVKADVQDFHQTVRGL